MTSSSSQGLSQITLQFTLTRDIDAAAQDVQAAINAAASTLPRNLPYPPTYAKLNPADAPIITLALTSQTIPLRTLSDLADTLMVQRLASVSGVGHVSVEGGIKPAVRIQADLARLAAYGLSMADVRSAITAANVSGPKGSLDGQYQSYSISSNDQITNAEAYKEVIVAWRNSAPVLLKDVAQVVDGLENNRVGGWHQDSPAVIIGGASRPSCRASSAPCRAASSSPWCTTAPAPSPPPCTTCSSPWC
jgi:multidrug efflux pump